MNVSRSSFPPEYLAEDVSAPLLGTSIAFLILETLFIVLLYTSRYLSKGERANLSMQILLTLTYIVCVGKITIAFRKPCISSNSKHLADIDLQSSSASVEPVITSPPFSPPLSETH
jgi:hypothetical protein